MKAIVAPHPFHWRPSPTRVHGGHRAGLALGVAASVWTIAAASQLASEPGHLGYVLNPAYLLSLAFAATVAAGVEPRRRPAGAVGSLALLATTLALQVALLLLWNLGVFGWLLGRVVPPG